MEAIEVLEKLIENDCFLKRNKCDLTLVQHSFFNHCTIKFNNENKTEKYRSIYVDLNDDNTLTIVHKFCGNISQEPLKIDIWNRYMETQYVAPTYGHEDSEIKCKYSLEDYRIKILITDLLKCFMYYKL